MFNIFTLVFFAVAFGLILAMWVTRRKTPEPIQFIPPEDAFQSHDPKAPSLKIEHLYAVAEKLSLENKLTIKDKMPDGAHDALWVAESNNEFFFGNYVFGFHEATEDHPFVTMTDILEFKDFIKSAGSTKGFFFTTGYFTKDVFQPLEGPKVALYNRPKILEELARFGLSSPQI